MHNRKEPNYGLFFVDMLEDFKHILSLADQAGIARSQIILDPGVGFGKTYAHNLEAIHRLPELVREFQLPVLLGTSRKSVIGLTLDLPADQRVEGTIATSVIAAMAGCMFVRVHDVEANARAVKMTEAICRA
jgi:dihydropteroate synthase